MFLDPAEILQKQAGIKASNAATHAMDYVDLRRNPLVVTERPIPRLLNPMHILMHDLKSFS